MKFRLLVLVALPLLCTSCILIPCPHEARLTPKFEGRVTDYDTGKPLKDVQVTLSNSILPYKEEFGKDSVTETDSLGHYTIAVTQHTDWVFIWLLGGLPPIYEAHLTYFGKGYEPLEERKNWNALDLRHTFLMNAALKRGKAIHITSALRATHLQEMSRPGR